MASIHGWLLRVGWTCAVWLSIGCGDDGSSGGGGAGAGGNSLGGAPAGGAPATGGAGGAQGSGGKSAEFEAVETLVFSGCGGGFGPMTCHAPNGQGELAGDLDLREGHAWAALVNKPATQSPGKTLVIPGDVEGSFLWQKLNDQLGPDEGDPMPKGEGIQWMLPSEDKLNAVRAWIEAGAPD